MTLIAERLKSIKPSPTLSLSQKASELQSLGHDIINLTAGEPDFPTPEWACDAAIKAIQNGETRYTNVTGTPALKQAIQAKFQRENGLSYHLNEIIVGVGAKQILFNAFLATINPGDEVIIPAPYWVSYSDMVLLAGGIPKIVQCGDDEGFKLSPNKFEQAITNRTKWFVLNSPSNPTGAVYTKDELAALAQVLKNHTHVYIMSDDIYEHISYTAELFSTIAAVAPYLQDRTLTINGVSKAYAMTGWRIGYAAGPKNIISAMGMLQSQSTSNPCSIAQAASVAALNGQQEFLKDRCNIFKERRDMVVNALNQVEGISCLNPEGAFYVFPSCQNLLGKRTAEGHIINTDNDFAAYLLNDAGIAVVPGSAFGLDGYIRISYALDMDTLQKACERITIAAEALI